MKEEAASPKKYSREVQTTFLYKRIDEAVHDGDHHQDQDGVHSLQEMRSGILRLSIPLYYFKCLYRI